MRRGGRIRRRTPLRARNPERAERKRAAAFGPQAQWCRTARCSVPWCQVVGCDPHHVPSRGAGGVDKDTVPLCRKHHDEFHVVGERQFDVRYQIVLREVARALSVRFKNMGDSQQEPPA